MDPDEIRARMQREANRINAKRDLAPHAKRTMLARIYVQARDALNEMREQEAARIDAERHRIERRLFGSDGQTIDPTTAISRRDAADRAAAIDDPDEALKVMRRAERSGDAALAQAIAAHAADLSQDHRWADVLGAYAATRPDAAESISRLREMPDTRDGVYRMRQAVTYSVMPPDGLGDVSGYQVDALAGRPLDSDSPAA